MLLHLITLGQALEPRVLLEYVVACTNNIKYPPSTSKITEIQIELMKCCTAAYLDLILYLINDLFYKML